MLISLVVCSGWEVLCWKFWGRKGTGLKLGVEKSRVEVSYNLEIMVEKKSVVIPFMGVVFGQIPVIHWRRGPSPGGSWRTRRIRTWRSWGTCTWWSFIAIRWVVSWRSMKGIIERYVEGIAPWWSRRTIIDIVPWRSWWAIRGSRGTVRRSWGSVRLSWGTIIGS